MGIRVTPKLYLMSVETMTYAHWCVGCNAPHCLATALWCPSRDCKALTCFGVEAPQESLDHWSFHGDFAYPTFVPDALVIDPVNHTVCHYKITEGTIEYFEDTTHALKGQTVPLPDFPINEPSRKFRYD